MENATGGLINRSKKPTFNVTFFKCRNTMKQTIKSIALGLALMGAVSAQAASVNITDATRNSTKNTAFNLDRFFDKSFNANILNSTQSPHATAIVTTNSGTSFDWFKFTTTKANTKVVLDVDGSTGGLNTWLTLENATGPIANNGDSVRLDNGSTTLLDSYLTYILPTAGQYFIRVAHQTGNGGLGGLTRGQNYVLNVSQVPVPAAVWLFGSALVGLVGMRKKSKLA